MAWNWNVGFSQKLKGFPKRMCELLDAIDLKKLSRTSLSQEEMAMEENLCFTVYFKAFFLWGSFLIQAWISIKLMLKRELIKYMKWFLLLGFVQISRDIFCVLSLLWETIKTPRIVLKKWMMIFISLPVCLFVSVLNLILIS